MTIGDDGADQTERAFAFVAAASPAYIAADIFVSDAYK
jgi:hypothetical protein